jgi:AraC family transcriptional regulator, transcriptional activator of the genes for pyochelin and ferripyochelin receptors
MKTTRFPFNIISCDAEPVLFTDNVPDFFKDYEVEGATHHIAFGSFGHMSFQECCYPDLSLSIIYFNALVTKNQNLLFPKIEDEIQLFFAVTNNFCFIQKDDCELELAEGKFNLFYFPVSNTQQKFLTNRLYSGISIHISRSYLEHWSKYYPILNDFLNTMERGQPGTLCKSNQVIDIQMSDIIRQITSNKYQGIARSMYIDIKIKELFMLVMEKVSYNPLSRNSTLSKTEVEQFGEAKDLLLSNMQHPMSLKQISKKFGLNTKKIKTGFKQLYQMTPFSLLFTTRMERAKAMLTCSEMDIAAIADEIGYDNKQSFSKAFKKYFGHPPGKFRKGKQDRSTQFIQLENAS